MKRYPLLLLSLALACGDKDLDTATTDADGDGVVGAADCDDNNASAFTGADEVCDGVDNNCDGVVDEDAIDGTPWYLDADGDGYGVQGEPRVACSQPQGYAPVVGDCDDGDPRFHPGASEQDCTDPVDYNCDGSVGFEDADGDGFAACEDCDDSSDQAHPDAEEVCDAADNDCDGEVDEQATDATTWYIDYDADSYGSDSYTLVECEQPEGYVSNAEDCDDTSGLASPDGTEVCDDLDNDCDGQTDESDAVDAVSWYNDADEDGFGDPQVSTLGCAAPSGFVEDATDCDDGDGAVNPDATEVCDLWDNNCDGDVDEDSASDATTWYLDYDGDDFGTSFYTVVACDAPSGFADNADDCEDADADINPDADEVCDGDDNDCDGTTDQGAIDALTWYYDDDGDGFGDPSVSTDDCDQPTDYVSDDTDCDDADADVNTDADELCDSVDNNCDGTVDEATAIDADTWYIDSDGDGYGDSGTTQVACDQPSGYVDNKDDCDDGDSSVQECTCGVSSVTGPTYLVSRGQTHGAWVADPLETLGAGIVWELNGYSNKTQVVEYPSQAAMVSGSSTKTITLSTGWEGTGAAVYDGHLYYPAYNSNTLVEVDLSTNTVVSTLSLSGAGYHNTYSYGWGGYSDIDFAVDEYGLWVIYATSANSSKVVVSRLETQPLNLTGTWNTNSASKSGMGNAFMICGVLYTTASYSGSSTTINYWFDTSDSSDGSLSIPFSQPGGYLTQISYNPTDGLLYVWNSSRHETYVVNY